ARQNKAQILVFEEDVGHFSGRTVAVPADCQTDIRRAECGAVVDPVAQHSHDRPGALQRAHDLQLLGGADAGEHIDHLGDAGASPVAMIERTPAFSSRFTTSPTPGRTGSERPARPTQVSPSAAITSGRPTSSS